MGWAVGLRGDFVIQKFVQREELTVCVRRVRGDGRETELE